MYTDTQITFLEIIAMQFVCKFRTRIDQNTTNNTKQK